MLELQHGEIIQSVRDYLRNPPEDVLPMHLLLRSGRDEDAQLCNDLDLSGQNWRITSVPVPVDSGTDVYTVPVASSAYGRSDFAEAELPAPMHGRRRVRIVDLKDQDALTGGQVATSNTLLIGSQRRVEELSIYRDPGGNVMMRVVPWPVEPRTYILYYSPGAVSFTALSGTPQALRARPTYANLLIARMVASMAPYCASFLAAKGVDAQALVAAQRVRIDHPTNGLLVQWNQDRANDNDETDVYGDGFDIGTFDGRFF